MTVVFKCYTPLLTNMIPQQKEVKLLNIPYDGYVK